MSKSLLVGFNLLAALGLLLAYLSTHISPEKANFLALFGIGYGALLVVNLGFILFWLLVKKRLALISVITILLGFNHLSAYFQILPPFFGGKPEGNSLKVVSYNVRLFGWYNWRNNIRDRDIMVEGLQDVQGDIFCFQEYFHNSSPGVFETRRTLKRALDASYVHEEFTNTLYNSQHYGIATFSKYPIVGYGKINFESERSNICIYSDIVVGDDTVRVYNAHVASIRFRDGDYRFVEKLQDTDDDQKPLMKDALGIIDRLNIAYIKRASQVKSIVDHVKTSPYPVIVCGDFNDTPVSYSYARLSDDLVDSFRESGWGIGNTYIGRFPSFRIDYIFHSPSLQSADYSTLSEKVSDHHAITTTIYWED